MQNKGAKNETKKCKRYSLKGTLWTTINIVAYKNNKEIYTKARLFPTLNPCRIASTIKTNIKKIGL